MKAFRILSALLALCLTGCGIAHSEAPSTAATHAWHETTAQTTEPSVQQTAIVETTVATEEMTTQPTPEDDAFVLVAEYLPDAIIALPYSTADNFTGQVIYGFADAWLRYGTVKKLMGVQAELREKGLTLKFWDCFRPTAAQFLLWEVFPDPAFVADPRNGFSSHSRGNTVDVTLAYADGRELTMPTAFDDFTAFADRNYSDCTQEAAANARLLEELMVKHGFKPYAKEWWHFSDTNTYPVEEDFYPPAPQK